MRAVVFIPDCCGRGRLVAEEGRFAMGVKALLDKYLCGELHPHDAIKEIVKLCKKVDGRRAMFGWTLVVGECLWEEVEEVVSRAGGDIVYMK
jgi:hypothetical protein